MRKKEETNFRIHSMWRSLRTERFNSLYLWRFISKTSRFSFFSPSNDWSHVCTHWCFDSVFFANFNTLVYVWRKRFFELKSNANELSSFDRRVYILLMLPVRTLAIMRKLENKQKFSILLKLIHVFFVLILLVYALRSCYDGSCCIKLCQLFWISAFSFLFCTCKLIIGFEF